MTVTAIARIVSLLALLLASAGTIADDIPPEKLAAIRKLIEVTNAEANSAEFSRAFSQQMMSVIRANNPAIPERAVTIVQEEVARMVEQELANETLQARIYPIYANYFTVEELNGLIAFNESDIGRKANAVMPQLMQQSLFAAQSWSEEVGPKISERVLQRFREEGITLERSQ